MSDNESMEWINAGDARRVAAAQLLQGLPPQDYAAWLLYSMQPYAHNVTYLASYNGSALYTQLSASTGNAAFNLSIPPVQGSVEQVNCVVVHLV